MDLSATTVPKSDQLNADDLLAGPRTIVITRVTGNEGSPDQPVNVWFEGDGGKPYRPCKSMRRVLIAAWGPDASAFAGRAMTLYRDAGVQFGGMAVGGIRISHMSHIERDLTMALTVTKAKRAPYTVKVLAAPAKVDLAALKERARLAAMQGTVTFKGFWNRDDVKPHRDALKPFLDEYKRLSSEADAKGAPGEPDPFGAPDAEDRARAEFEAERERELAAASCVERGADE